jgi:hypothetical protein
MALFKHLPRWSTHICTNIFKYFTHNVRVLYRTSKVKTEKIKVKRFNVFGLFDKNPQKVKS